MKHLRRIASLLLAAGLTLSCGAALSGCAFGPVLKVYCDGDLIRESLLDDFTEETGIRVELVTGNSTPDSTDEADGASSTSAETEAAASVDLLSALQPGDADGDGEEDAPAYDVVFTSGETIAALIDASLVQELDKEAISNAALIDEDFQACSYDPTGAYSVTTLWQTMGLLWNTDLYNEEITSWSDLWSEALSGHVLMTDSLRDALALSLTRLGYAADSTDADALSAAWAELAAQQASVQEYVSADGYALLAAGEAWMMPAYSGDALEMMAENEALSFTFPKEGTWRTSYGFCIVSGIEHTEEASELINYLCSAENLAKNANYTKYSVTSAAALELLDSSWRSNPLAYPEESLIADAPLLGKLEESLSERYGMVWEALAGSV